MGLLIFGGNNFTLPDNDWYTLSVSDCLAPLCPRMCRCVCTPVSGHGGQRLKLGVSCTHSPLYVSETGSFTDLLGWLVTEPQRASCVCLRVAGATALCHHARLFNSGWCQNSGPHTSAAKTFLLKPKALKDSFDVESLAQNQSRYCYESNLHKGMSYDTVFVAVLPAHTR